MDEDEKMSEATETADEREEQTVDDATPEEAHRIGEFDELRDLLMSIRADIAGLRESMGTYQAVQIDNGAEPATDGDSVNVANGADLKNIEEPASDAEFFADL